MNINDRLPVLIRNAMILVGLICGLPASGQIAKSGDIFSNTNAGPAQIVFQTGFDNAAAPQPAVLYADGPYWVKGVGVESPALYAETQYWWDQPVDGRSSTNAFNPGDKPAAYMDVAMNEGCENLAVYIPVNPMDSSGIFCAATVRARWYEAPWADVRMGCAVSDSAGNRYVGFPYSREDGANEWQYWKAETGLLHWEFPELKFVGPAVVLTRHKDAANIRIVVRLYWDEVTVKRLRPEEMPAIQALLSRPHPCLDTNSLTHSGPYPKEMTDDPELKQPIVVSARPGGYDMNYQCTTCGCLLQTKDGIHHFCPKCGKDYTTPRVQDAYIQVVRSQHVKLMTSLSSKYLKTGYRPYGEWVKECLLKYAGAHKTIPVGWAGGRFRANWLGDLYFAEPAVEAYDRITDVCTDAERKTIEDDLFRLMARTDYRFQSSSYPEGYIRVARSVGKIGVVVRDPELMYLCFYSPHTGFDTFMGFFDPEGLSVKFGAYHLSMLQGLTTIAQNLERGADGVITAKLRFLQNALERTRFPDASLPGFAHNNLGPDGLPSTVELPSTNFMYTGLSFLRSTTPRGPVCLAMHWGIPLRNDAGVMDIQYYALGRHLVRPSGTTSYSNKYFGEWYMHALSANTIVIDGANHEPVAGRLVYSDYEGDYRIACARVDGVAPGVTMHRHLVLLPEGYAVVIDRVLSATPHTYDWVCHGKGRMQVSMLLTAAPDSLGNGTGHCALTNIFRSGPTGEFLTAEFQGPSVKNEPAITLKLTMIQDAAGEVFTADGLEGFSPASAPMLMVRRDGTPNAVFVTVMEPLKQDEPSQIRKVSLEPVEIIGVERDPKPSEALAVRIEMSDHSYIVTSGTVDGSIRCGDFITQQPAAVRVQVSRPMMEEAK